VPIIKALTINTLTIRTKVEKNILLLDLFRKSDFKNVNIEIININKENPIASSPILNPKI